MKRTLIIVSDRELCYDIDMLQDEQKNLPPAEQKKIELEPAADIEAKRKELERLKQELAELERRAAEKKPEVGQEAAERIPEIKVEEGQVGKEVSEVFSVPAAVQIQQQAQQIKDLDKDNQVKILCDLAFQKGIDFAIKTAQNLNNAYILDAFHDTLVDQLYERLVQEKKIEEV